MIDKLEPWLHAELALISQKLKLAEGIRYAPSRWAGLTRFLDDGRIERPAAVPDHKRIWTAPADARYSYAF